MTYLLYSSQLHFLIRTACFLDYVFQRVTIICPIDDHATRTCRGIVRIQRTEKKKNLKINFEESCFRLSALKVESGVGDSKNMFWLLFDKWDSVG